MPVDPYGNAPSREDLKRSGTEDWVEEALKQQRQKEAALLGALGEATEALDESRRELSGLLDLPPAPEEMENAPDLFAAEREKARQEQAGLSQIFGCQMEERLAEEQALLGDLFGVDPKKKKL